MRCPNLNSLASFKSQNFSRRVNYSKDGQQHFLYTSYMSYPSPLPPFTCVLFFALTSSWEPQSLTMKVTFTLCISPLFLLFPPPPRTISPLFLLFLLCLGPFPAEWKLSSAPVGTKWQALEATLTKCLIYNISSICSSRQTETFSFTHPKLINLCKKLRFLLLNWNISDT